MAIKCVCDRCGKEVANVTVLNPTYCEVTVSFPSTITHVKYKRDLCQSCESALRRFLDNKLGDPTSIPDRVFHAG